MIVEVVVVVDEVVDVVVIVEVVGVHAGWRGATRTSRGTWLEVVSGAQ